MADAKYWDDRATRFGHTGWADPVVYAFDQAARLAAVERILASTWVRRGLALDFGAGSGDFTRLLAKHFARVLAFDISPIVTAHAQAKYGSIRNIEFCHGESVKNLALEDGSIDVILSVTVLGHILDDSECRDTLSFFRRKIDNKGILIAFEATPVAERDGGGYQRFRTREQLRKLFDEAGFTLQKQYGFYNPDEEASRSYIRYARDFRVRLLQRLRFGKLARAVFRNTAGKILAAGNDCLWDARPADPMSVMIFAPNVEC
ncbi:MAG TPA: methyltransferase domain-containing protein [Candidatus Binatia bacterium]|jgi:ubiquinone/menaquinone biosynthesis C-methylase UbiE